MNPLRLLGALLGGATRGAGAATTDLGAVVKDAGEVVQGAGGALGAVPAAVTAALPPAEPGATTSEWHGSLITKLLIVGFGIADATGVMHVPPAAQTAILAAVPPALALEHAAYSISRAWRKVGTG